MSWEMLVKNKHINMWKKYDKKKKLYMPFGLTYEMEKNICCHICMFTRWKYAYMCDKETCDRISYMGRKQKASVLMCGLYFVPCVTCLVFSVMCLL